MESLKLTEGINIIGIDRMDQYTIKTPMAGLHAWLGWFAFLKMPMLKASQSNSCSDT